MMDIEFQLDIPPIRMLDNHQGDIAGQNPFSSHYRPLRIHRKSNFKDLDALSLRYTGMFTRSHHFIIQGGSFVDITNGMDGIQYLAQNIAFDAKHNSGQRSPPPKCHPGTRMSIIRDLLSWICDVDALSKILWLNGSAGTGKSAVAQTVCEKLEKMHLLGASFFFSRTKHTRNNVQQLFTTIAYQLAVSLPSQSFRETIKMQLAHDPDIIHQTMEIQWFKLVVAPFKAAIEKDGGSNTPMVIVIDGLNECLEETSQVRTLNLVTAANVYGLPLRFILTSRLEPHLRDIFSMM
ncbi:hypothetical protein BDQ17DRAFT_894517 [Cyathus striatus]|nr:hypothetical protein BDQ17DRAFT_894517 [Cyathus striatus]